MKKYFFATLLACVGLMSSCSSDSDDQYNLTVGEEISSIVKVGENGMDLKNPESKWNTDTVACYHSEAEWKVLSDDISIHHLIIRKILWMLFQVWIGVNRHWCSRNIFILIRCCRFRL